MKASAVVAAGVLTLAAGCVSGGSALDRHFRSGEFSEVVRAFEADSTLHERPAAMYRAGLAYALPDSPVYDPDRALAVFDRLQALHPKHPQREHVAQLQQLLRHVDLQEERQMSRDARLRAQQSQIDELKAQLAREKTRADRLDREVREREARIRALQDELAALKQIDLSRPPSGGAVVSPPRAPQP